MPRYNTKFDLSIEDMELIEAALRTSSRLSTEDAICPREANDLLGRLHNQKVFYRPRDGVYVSG
ncbi:MAG: hypothetical protein QNJ13_03365 [Paracoccaceae bacterium]|nr:hypothetical protein [Paracoccaceae bacterium]